MDLDLYYATKIAEYRTNQPSATNPPHTTHRTPILTRLRTALNAATTRRTQPTTPPHHTNVHPVN